MSDPEGFRILSSETVGEVGFLTISRKRIAAPDGEEHLRTVVHHPGAVVVVPVEGDDALLVRQYRVAVEGEILELPAGKRDVEGEPPAETAARELEEEIGRVAGRLDLLCEFWNTPGFCDEYSYLYLATELREVARNAVSAEEAHMELVRVPLAGVEAMIASREIVDAKTIIGLLLAKQHLAGG
ncbi:MAG: NUDIX hydrolase [Acidimicrobiia bacterium]